MVTLPTPARLNYVRSSVADYVRQTYPNKELLVVINGGLEADRATLSQYLRSLERDDIRIFEPSGVHPIGYLRNLSFENADGEVVCQWDDDDRYHPDRLEKQLTALTSGGFEAIYLQEVLQYVPQRRAIYWTNWRATEASAHPGTLMALRTAPIVYPHEGENARLGEDLQLALELERRGQVGRLTGEPHLFIYVSHGANSWSDAHHAMLISKLSISRGLLMRRREELIQNLSAFEFPAEGVTVFGANGPAFDLTPRMAN